MQKTNKIISVGEILMRIQPIPWQRWGQSQQAELYFGGSEANVTSCLAYWGYNALHIGQVPNHSLGDAAIDHLKKSGLETGGILQKPGRMGLYFLENGLAQRSPEVIYDRFNTSFEQLDPNEFDLASLLKDGQWFHWSGISPAISQSVADLCLKALALAKRQNMKVSADINYRRVLWKYGKSPHEVMPDLIRDSHIIVGGRQDINNCMGWEEPDFTSACQRLMAEFPTIELIACTQRETKSASHHSLSAKYWDEKGLYELPAYDIYPIQDRVGSGDAFMAGLIHGLITTDHRQALAWGLASAVMKHSIPGDVNLCRLGELEQLIQGNGIGKLLR